MNGSDEKSRSLPAAARWPLWATAVAWLASFRALRNGIAIPLSLCTKDGQQRFIRERGFPLEAMEGRAVHCG